MTAGTPDCCQVDYCWLALTRVTFALFPLLLLIARLILPPPLRFFFCSTVAASNRYAETVTSNDDLQFRNMHL